jgi:cell division transport system permease protein
MVMRWLRATGYALAHGFIELRAARRAHLWAALGCALLLGLLGLARLGADNLDQLAARWDAGVQMVVYLEPQVGEARARDIAAGLERMAAVRGVHFVSAGEAGARLREAMGPHAGVIDQLPPGALPVSLEVTLQEGLGDVAAVHPIVSRLRQMPGVEDVEFLGDWVDGVTSLVGGLRTVATGSFVLLALLCAGAIVLAIRIHAARTAEQGEVLSLLGARPLFTMAPLVAGGLALGLGATLLALGGLALLHLAAAPLVERVLAAAAAPVTLEFLSPRALLELVALGACAGLVAGVIAGRGLQRA